jgi:hypothetical protein
LIVQRASLEANNAKLQISGKGFAKEKQLAQKTAGNRNHYTSCVCRGLVDGVAQGCDIRSPVALAWRVRADYPLSVTIT